MTIDAQDLIVTFLFSGHKMLGPTGIGVFTVKKNLIKCHLLNLVVK